MVGIHVCSHDTCLIKIWIGLNHINKDFGASIPHSLLMKHGQLLHFHETIIKIIVNTYFTLCEDPLYNPVDHGEDFLGSFEPKA